MLINLIGQFNSIAQRDDALFSGMHEKQAKSDSVKNVDVEGMSLSIIHRAYSKDKQLTFVGIKNDFIAKAMNAWYESLSDKI